MFAASVALFLVISVLAVQSRHSARTPMFFDGPVFESVEGLSRSADVVVEVQVNGVADRVVDHGGEKPLKVDPVDGEELSPDGLPIALYEVEVIDPVVGDLRPGQTILVPLLDEKVIESEHVVALEKGARYLLFLDRFGVDDAGFDTGGEDLFLPLNYNNGVLPRRGDSVALNRWTLAMTQREADDRVGELADLEARRGYEAVEAVLAAQDKVEVDQAELKALVSEFARSGG